MTSLSTQIESTRERIVREQKRLVLGAERATRALTRAAREEATSWQSFVTAEQRRVRDAVQSSLAEISSRTGFERVVLRAAERRLADAHASVRARLGKIDRELAADATPTVLASSDRPRAKARRPSPSKKTH